MAVSVMRISKHILGVKVDFPEMLGFLRGVLFIFQFLIIWLFEPDATGDKYKTM